jgi:hypothetical protein
MEMGYFSIESGMRTNSASSRQPGARFMKQIISYIGLNVAKMAVEQCGVSKVGVHISFSVTGHSIYCFI